MPAGARHLTRYPGSTCARKIARAVARMRRDLRWVALLMVHQFLYAPGSGASHPRRKAGLTWPVGGVLTTAVTEMPGVPPEPRAGGSMECQAFGEAINRLRPGYR